MPKVYLMMCFLLFHFFFFSSSKEFMFFSSSIQWDTFSSFMASISPLVFFVLAFMLFIFFNTFYKKIYSISFGFLILVVSLSFLASSSFVFLFFLECSVSLMILLMLSFSKDLDKITSLTFMIFINLTGSIPFMFFVWSCVNPHLMSMPYLLNSHNSWMVFFSLLLVLASKLPLFMIHFWLTKAHVSASGSCSMVLASLMLKLGSFGFFKFCGLFYCFSNVFFIPIFSMSISGCLILSIMMMRFFDLKYLIACSSIVHMGGIFPMLSFGTSMGVSSSMYMMVGHGLISYFLFFLVTLFYEGSFSRSYTLNKSGESTSKILSMIFTIFAFLNLGVPPFVNFLSEMQFMGFVLGVSFMGSFLLFMLMLSCVIFSMIVILKVLFGKKTSFSPLKSNSKLGLTSLKFFWVSLFYSLLF